MKMEKINVELAKKSDDRILNKILRQNEMKGKISIAFQRNPSYFSALKIEGKQNQVIVGRNEKDEIIGFGTRSIKPIYINGRVKNVGYLSNLRIVKGYKEKGYLSEGYNYLKKLHQDKKVDIYYSTILEGNRVAIKILTSKKSYLPNYHDIGRYCTIAINLFTKQKKYNNKLKIIKGSTQNLMEIVNFINKNGSKKQFYPFYTLSDFTSKNSNLIGFDIKDFYVALKDEKIVGVIGKWDQRQFRQIIITGYKGAMLVIKSFYNLIARFMGVSPLPKPNTQLRFLYVSFIAIEKDYLEIFKELLYTLYNDSVGKGYSHILIGLHSNDSLLKVVDEFNHIKFNSRLYIVCWQDGEKFFNELDNRIPYIELSTL
ncbi:MAG: hypothetical protein AABX78_02245 [Nanoarchaeota archaeon]